MGHYITVLYKIKFQLNQMNARPVSGVPAGAVVGIVSKRPSLPAATVFAAVPTDRRAVSNVPDVILSAFCWSTFATLPKPICCLVTACGLSVLPVWAATSWRTKASVATRLPGVVAASSANAPVVIKHIAVKMPNFLNMPNPRWNTFLMVFYKKRNYNTSDIY